ncbi:[F-actin]-monooxygenase mical1, variant 2 [Globodera pallida]|nr:[F-actin]-monooxygenase mical1, variant 2 [Globodera pallida]
MRVKDLVRWVDSFGLPNAPWAVEAADWATVLNLLSRLLHRQLAERMETEEKRRKNAGTEGKEEQDEQQQEEEEGEECRRESAASQQHPSTQLPFHQALQLAECALGAPQLAVLADTKTGAEVDNQLSLFVTLCSLRFAMGTTETKPYRIFQFTFRIYFDMENDESSRFCASCGESVHFIERLILEGRTWHRTCLKCALCGRQLYRGAFHCSPGDGMALECVEHFANRVLFGDPKHRLALPPPFHHAAQSATEKRMSLLSTASSMATPPPRPPPPKAAAIPSGHKIQEATDEESIEKKIASATAARHDAPTPKPRTTTPGGVLGSVDMNSRMTEKDASCCWEQKMAPKVLKYPEELNPFGLEDEADDNDQMEQNPFGDSASSSGDSELVEPRKERTHDVDEHNCDDGGEEGDDDDDPEEVQNPQDRVQTCSSAGDESSACPSPARPPMVQIASAATSPLGEENISPEGKQTAKISTDDKMPTTAKIAESKPLHNEQGPSMAAEDKETTHFQYKYIPPLAPMLFRTVSTQPQKYDAFRPLAPSGDDSSKQYQQHSLYDLDTRLRKLHAQLDQWEITGARLEGQLLREMGNKEKSVWKKGGLKLANEYAYVVEQRLTALSLEAQLVRRYMNAFLEVAHAELDGQMKAAQRVGANVSDDRRQLFCALLAQLLHMRNELTELELRDRSARTSIAHAAAEECGRKRETAKAAKKEAKREKEDKSCAGDQNSLSEVQRVPSTTEQQQQQQQQQQQKRTMLKMKGVKQSLVNTLRKKL